MDVGRGRGVVGEEEADDAIKDEPESSSGEEDDDEMEDDDCEGGNAENVAKEADDVVGSRKEGVGHEDFGKKRKLDELEQTAAQAPFSKQGIDGDASGDGAGSSRRKKGGRGGDASGESEFGVARGVDFRGVSFGKRRCIFVLVTCCTW